MGYDFYDRLAADYDTAYQDRRSLNENTAVGYLLERFRRVNVLDMGCGTALAAKIGRLTRYYGLDIAPAMIARARANVPQGVYTVGDMGALNMAEGIFDAVISIFGSFSYARDPWKVVGEIDRVLAPGGRFLIMGYGPNHGKAEGYKRLCRLAACLALGRDCYGMDINEKKIGLLKEKYERGNHVRHDGR